MNQKGITNIALVIIVVIVVLAVGYLAFRKPASVIAPSDTSQTSQPPVSPLPLTQTNNPGWKKYSDASISFEYPALISARKDGTNILLSHSIVYRHNNPCDFKGDAPPLETLNDFNVSLSIVNKSLQEYVRSTDYPGWDYVSDNPFKLGSWNGYKFMVGVEGCGADVYYFAISPTMTLVIGRTLITELSPISGTYQANLKLPGIIPPSQADEFFNKILTSLKVN